ncbi:MAG TPA: electron transfer flavoprotein subunit alpha/FixB family protein [Victivallales bacterium]|nr:electron transfer flavoprotein subunit alpha/FixB family protein [Victivallales bacterium]
MADKIGNVWVFIEQEGGKIAEVSLELVCKATDLAKRLKVKVETVVLGDNLEGKIDSLFHYGADVVYQVEHKALEPFTILPYAEALVELVKQHKPNILLFGASLKGRELGPRVASETLSGLTADCTDLQIDDFVDRLSKKSYTNKLMQIRPAFGGNIIATIVNTWEDPQMVTVREGVMKMSDPDTLKTGKIVKIKPTISAKTQVIKVLKRISEEKAIDLKKAQIIISGGYGVGSKENFKQIYDLADALGGDVGASRAAVDAGWIDHDHQVGQTGVTVRPKLYIACGISGSVQHRAGMDESSKIIAVNNDPDAPIFGVAHYGIIGDLNDVVPKMIKAFKEKV